MNAETIKQLLANYKEVEVINYISYCDKLLNARNKDGRPKNPWMAHYSDRQLADLFIKVNADGLVFDGIAVALQSTGISYTYIAYKNKMLAVYPESIIDMQLVFVGDTFQFEKKSGHVVYEHVITDPFENNEENLVGGYCVIKNKRGEFLTLLNKDEIEKHRKIAKTDMIWQNWFKEMALKTLIKKACKQHFMDIFANLDATDNECNYNIELPLGIDVKVKAEIEAIQDIKELERYYHENKERNSAHLKDFNKLITVQKELLLNKNEA